MQAAMMISLTRAPLGRGAGTRPALHLPHPYTSTCTFVLSLLPTQMCMAGSNNTIHIRRVSRSVNPVTICLYYSNTTHILRVLVTLRDDV